MMAAVGLIGDDPGMAKESEPSWKVLGGAVVALAAVGLFLATIIWGDGADPLGTILRWIVR